MNKSKKILTISIITILISALVSIVLVNKLSLKNPVFFMNYRELRVSEMTGRDYIEGEFNLSFVTNIQDKRKVSSITFEELPNTKFDILDNDEESSSYNLQEGRYKVKSVELTCCDFIEMNDVEEKMITKADVEFDDGSTLEVDLGKIVFYKDQNNEDSKRDIEHTSVSSSSDGTAKSEYKVNEDIKIEKIDSPLYDEIKDVFTFDINSIRYDEEKGEFLEEKENMKKGAYLAISSEYISKDILNKFTVYAVRPKIYYFNNENVRKSVRCYNMFSRFTNSERFDGLYEYLKARGEL